MFICQNLFGFEKKLRVKYNELVEIAILRTTSLYLRTADDEEHGECRGCGSNNEILHDFIIFI